MSEIKVEDHRLFDKDGNVKAENKAENQDSPAAESQKEPPKNDQKNGPKNGQAPFVDVGDMPATVGILFLELATGALIHMGEKVADEKSAQNEPNLPAAKRLIDLLGELEKKTKGNLDPEEESLLKALLYDVRLKYVSLTR
jgi:hypothetical protein